MKNRNTNLMPDRYYAFQQDNWHIIILDSFIPEDPDEHIYSARLDDDQALL